MTFKLKLKKGYSRELDGTAQQLIDSEYFKEHFSFAEAKNDLRMLNLKLRKKMMDLNDKTYMPRVDIVNVETGKVYAWGG